jgi:diguanylate cyclase (GGDEF)-like protein
MPLASDAKPDERTGHLRSYPRAGGHGPPSPATARVDASAHASRIADDILRRFAGVGADHIDKRLEDVLSFLAGEFQMHRASICELSPADGTLVELLAWPTRSTAPEPLEKGLWLRLADGELIVAPLSFRHPSRALGAVSSSLGASAGFRIYAPIDASGPNRFCLMLEHTSSPAVHLPAEYAARLRETAEALRDGIERRRMHEALRSLAHYDLLTGFANKGLIGDRIRASAARARRRGRFVALAFVNLDRFKTVNDSLGFAGGDLLLKEAARRLQGCLRENDSIGRLGADEFIVLIEDLGRPDDAVRTAERILASLEKSVAIEGQEVFTSASVGIAVFGPEHRDSPDSLIRNASLAMTWAKKQGGNRFVFHEPQMHQRAKRRLLLETRLRNALARREFEIHYQPQLDLREGRITGAEALLRWRDPERGLVAPGDFLSVAEETGIIVPLSEWVVGEACRSALAWGAGAGRPLLVAVNVSARWIRHPEIARVIERALAESGLAPERLELEITEDVILSDAETSIALVKKLRAMGITIALDDFGTGYSSLKYLQRFPVDALKVDRSFVGTMAKSSCDEAIVAAMTTLGRRLGIRVVAEGVETDQALEALRELGCTQAQGHLIGKPQPVENFVALLKAHSAAQVASGAA